MLGALFPGQGSQALAMGSELAEAFPAVRARFDEADELLGIPLSRMMAEGPLEALTETHNTQPAVFLHSVAMWAVLRDAGFRATMASGHSLGEYSAFHAADAFDFADGLKTVRLRGELMFEEGNQRPGAMAAILGMTSEAVEGVARQAAEETGRIVTAANFNAPQQTAVSGEVEGVERAMALAREAGARRAVRLPVSGAFHSALMAPIAEKLRECLAEVPLRETAFPVVANATATPAIQPCEIRQSLATQLTAPVRWVESIRHMVDAGVTGFVEIGPGSVLRGLVRKIAPGVPCVSVSSPKTLDAAREHLGID